MLADRLLAKSGYDCDRELRTLELLKVRFGEGNLHGAEVMLKVRAGAKRGMHRRGVRSDVVEGQPARSRGDAQGEVR